MINAAEIIREADRITMADRKSYFKGLDVLGIRDWLYCCGFDRHMPIEAYSTEVAVLVPEGILMQVRSWENRLGFWGGEVQPDELPLAGAQRELFEETHLWVEMDEFEYVETYKHSHTYPSGDVCLYTTYRYIVRYPVVPKIELDYESRGYEVLKYAIFKDHVDFIEIALSRLKESQI